MLSSFLENLLITVSAGTITEMFLWLIASVLIVSLGLLKFGKEPEVVSYTPTLLTSLGILGTFVGIVVGLLAFDSESIQSSIGPLLEGLKTAFITSLVGMACSIFYKLVVSTGLIGPKRLATDPLAPEDIGAEHIHQAITQQSNALNDIKKGICGDDEGTLIGQLKLLKSDSNDNFKQLGKQITEQRESFSEFTENLWKQLENFAEMLSKSATEQVINALKEVIKDFNNQLTEQFGENFKQLNAAVKDLVVWQENYRLQLADMKEKYDHGVQAITITEGAVANISEKSSLIPANMEHMKTILETNQHQLAELERHLEAFRDMRDKAVEAVPEIRQQVDKTLQEIGQCVEVSHTQYNKLLEESDSFLKRYTDASNDVLTGFVDSTQQGIKAVNEGFDQGVEMIAKDLKESADKVKDVISDGAANFDETVRQGIQNVNEGFDQGLHKIAKDLKESTEQVSEVIGDGVNDFKVRVEESNASLQTMSNSLNLRTEEMSTTLEDAVSDMSGTMRSMVSDINEQAKIVSNDLAAGGQAVNKAVAEGINGINNTSQLVQRAHGEAQAKLFEYLEISRGRMESQMKEIHDQQSQQMQVFFKKLESNITDAATRTGESVNTQLEAGIRATEQEIEVAMNSMGTALTQVTGRFTDDYKGLVTQMSKVVRMELADNG